MGVNRVGTSLQQGGHTGRDSKACTKKQERILVVIRDDGVLRKRCPRGGITNEVKRRFADLSEEGRQGVRWVRFASRRACACMCVHAEMCV